MSNVFSEICASGINLNTKRLQAGKLPEQEYYKNTQALVYQIINNVIV